MVAFAVVRIRQGALPPEQFAQLSKDVAAGAEERLGGPQFHGRGLRLAEDFPAHAPHLPQNLRRFQTAERLDDRR